MKTRTTSSIILRLIPAFLVLGAAQAQAIIIICRPVGITFGQTARMTAANTGARTITLTTTFFDSEGAVLRQFANQLVQPGKMLSVDLNASDLVRERERIQIRVVISTDVGRGLLTSTEIFENATGKTTIALGGPDT